VTEGHSISTFGVYLRRTSTAVMVKKISIFQNLESCDVKLDFSNALFQNQFRVLHLDELGGCDILM